MDHDQAVEGLHRAFAAMAQDGLTAALVVRRGDEVLLDVAAGEDPRGGAFTSSTPVFLFSAVKPVAALAVLLAVADGELSLDIPVADLWPAFAAHGKDRVTVRDALAHGAAVPGWRERLDLSAFADRDAAADALAAAAPWWTPGEPGEHATSYGHLLDAILQRATGRGVTDWWDAVAAAGIGVRLRPGTGDDEPCPLRDADGWWQRHWTGAPGLMGDLLRNPPELLDVAALNSPAMREVVAPAVTGYGGAHDLAQLWSWWTGAAGAARLGDGLRDESLSPVLQGQDHVLGRHVSWALGPQVDAGSVGMGGVGGSFGIHLTGPDLSIGFTTADLSAPQRLDVLDPPLDALAQQR
jgi:CubicO group peptidase (beta-lactamase class C family)